MDCLSVTVLLSKTLRVSLVMVLSIQDPLKKTYGWEVKTKDSKYRNSHFIKYPPSYPRQILSLKYLLEKLGLECVTLAIKKKSSDSCLSHIILSCKTLVFLIKSLKFRAEYGESDFSKSVQLKRPVTSEARAAKPQAYHLVVKGYCDL